MPLPEAEGINLTLHPKSATAVWVSQLLAGIQFPNFVKKIIPRTIKQDETDSHFVKIPPISCQENMRNFVTFLTKQ
jgi:hypothetical protein